MVQVLSSVVSFIQDHQQLVPLTSCVARGKGLPSLPHGLHGCRSRCLHGPALHCCLLPHNLHGRCGSRCLHGTALHCCLHLHDLHGLHCLHGLCHCWKRKRFWITEAQTL